MANDSFDQGVNELLKKYKASGNERSVRDLLKEVGERETPNQFKENKLWSNGFAFNHFDKNFYKKWVEQKERVIF